MGGTIHKSLIGVGLMLLGSVANAQGIRLSVQQVWSGLESSQPNPYYANIENSGGNTEGVISSDGYGTRSSIEYPVELPSGSKKRVLFLSASYSEGKVLLRTPSGTKEATIKGTYSSEQTRYGLISDNPSDLIFLKTQAGGVPNGTGGTSVIGVGGCTPNDAPDRSFAYNCLDALVLGDGTEKLRDDQIKAIKIFVQSGGTLVFVGGIAQSASSDSRWKDILPISGSRVVTNGGLTELVGTARPGTILAKVSKGSCFGRSYGAGIVAIVSVNPFESPMRESEERRSIMSKAVRWNHKQTFRRLVNGQIGQYDYSSPYGSASSGVPLAASGAPLTVKGSGMPMTAASDPYEIKPPSLASIMWILIFYAIAVVPLNFLILKKLKKMEIAWVSTPVISVIFSLVLLNSTIGLYQANSTTRTMAITVLGDGNDDSLVFGKSEMFFPRAKSYDLGLKGIEAILPGESYRQSDYSGLSLKDDGRNIVAPNVQTANLAFKEFSYIQTSPELNGLTIKLVNQKGQTCIKVENRSKTAIRDITLFGAGQQRSVKKPVDSGKSIVLPVGDLVASKLSSKQSESVVDWHTLASASLNKIVVLANVESMNVGPKYGEGHPSSRFMVLSVPQWDESR